MVSPYIELVGAMDTYFSLHTSLYTLLNSFLQYVTLLIVREVQNAL